MEIKKIDINRTLMFFLFTHLFFWTLVPAISNVNLPLDTIEALAWGSDLEWGFNKHPPLSAFIVEIIYQIFGSQDWAYYFLSQLFIVLTFFIIFKFSEHFFTKSIYSLISVLLLEGIFFYNFTTPEFNVNICQLPFWALSVLYCWKGYKENKIKDWLLFGFFAGLGVLSKYLFVYLLAGIDVFFIYLIVKKKFNYRCLISLLTFLLVLIPHLIWLTNNDYITVTYALHRTGLGDVNLLNHFIQPLIFLVKQIGILIPFFLMFLFIASKFKNRLNFKDKKLIFLLAVNIIPIILMLLTSMLMGVKIRTMWMTPFYLFFGTLVIYIFKIQVDSKKLNNFLSIFLILFILSPTTYLFVSISQKNKKTDYPGKEIAMKVQEKWNSNFTSKIGYVSGNEWVAGNLSYHLKSRPQWIGIKGKVKSEDKLSIVDVYENDISEAIYKVGYFKVFGK